MTGEELEKRLAKAYNIEAMEVHGAGNLETELIGTVKRRNKLYDLYEDTEGGTWYKVRVITEHGIVSEYEAIFGIKERKRRYAS